MVFIVLALLWDVVAFQYSLCRVVLMVQTAHAFSVRLPPTFSTRSVESF